MTEMDVSHVPAISYDKGSEAGAGTTRTLSAWDGVDSQARPVLGSISSSRWDVQQRALAHGTRQPHQDPAPAPREDVHAGRIDLTFLFSFGFPIGLSLGSLCFLFSRTYSLLVSQLA